MLVHEFDDLMDAVPFKPFRVYTADGKGILVRGRQYAWHAPADRTIFVATGSQPPRKHVIDLHLVTRFTFVNGRSSGNGKAKH
jgi:hypothetical protein